MLWEKRYVKDFVKNSLHSSELTVSSSPNESAIKEGDVSQYLPFGYWFYVWFKSYLCKAI